MTNRIELKAEALLDCYRNALRVAYGREIAEKSELIYHAGWYYERRAQRFPDDSVGTLSGHRPAYRAAQFREMADELLRRAREE